MERVMRLISILILGILTGVPAQASEFCTGFKQGYQTGYKQSTGSSINPTTPLCPLQPLKKLNDPKSDFEHGYLIGLQSAQAANYHVKTGDQDSPANIAEGYLRGLEMRRARDRREMRRRQRQQEFETRPEREGPTYRQMASSACPEPMNQTSPNHQSVKRIRSLAQRGIAPAQTALGEMYIYGQDVAQNFEKAVKWLREAANTGDGKAQDLLGSIYADGCGVPVDYIRAYKWLYRATGQRIEGAVERLNLVGSRMQPEQIAEAQRLAREWRPVPSNLEIMTMEFDELHSLAKDGNQLAQSTLAGQYLIGFGGVKRDMEKSIKWYRKAAFENNDTYSMYVLASFYEDGTYLERDTDAALDLYHKAASLGDEASLGHDLAINRLSKIYLEGSIAEKDEAKAVKFLRISANNGSIDAQLKLGNMYKNGIGAPQDYVMAYMWYNLAASQEITSDRGETLVGTDLSQFFDKLFVEPRVRTARDRAAAARENIAQKMTPDQIAEAQRLAREWEPPGG